MRTYLIAVSMLAGTALIAFCGVARSQDLPFSKGDPVQVQGFLCTDVESAEKVITLVNKPDMDDASLMSTIATEKISCAFGHGTVRFDGTVATFQSGDTDYGIDAFKVNDDTYYTWHAMSGQAI